MKVIRFYYTLISCNNLVSFCAFLVHSIQKETYYYVVMAIHLQDSSPRPVNRFSFSSWIYCLLVWLEDKVVWEKSVANIFRVNVSCTLKMEEVGFFETLIFIFQNVWRHMPGQNNRRLVTALLCLHGVQKDDFKLQTTLPFINILVSKRYSMVIESH
jgi:hypothetical protein